MRSSISLINAASAASFESVDVVGGFSVGAGGCTGGGAATTFVSALDGLATGLQCIDVQSYMII